MRFIDADEDDVKGKAGENYTQIKVGREQSPFEYHVDYIKGDVDERFFTKGKSSLKMAQK